MKHAVILSRHEWDRLIPDLAIRLEQVAREPHGFRVISKASGNEIDDGLKEFLCGILAVARMDWEQERS